jgi:hypothetical protein
MQVDRCRSIAHQFLKQRRKKDLGSKKRMKTPPPILDQPFTKLSITMGPRQAKNSRSIDRRTTVEPMHRGGFRAGSTVLYIAYIA